MLTFHLNTISSQCFLKSSDTVPISSIPSTAKKGLLRQTHLCVYSGAPNGEFCSLSSHNFHPNQNHSKILERDWLSPARSEHLQDSARVIPVMKWSNRTVDTLCKWTVSDFVEHFAELTVVVFFFNENVQLMSIILLKFCHSSD